MPYAAKSPIPAEKTRAQIESVLKRSGADQIGSLLDGDAKAVTLFRIDNICIRTTLYLPLISDENIQFDRAGKKRTHAVAVSILEQTRRSHWRSWLLIIKAKLEAIEKGVSTTEREFYPDVVIPGTNVTMAEYIGPQLAQIRAGSAPSSLMLESKHG